MHICIRVSYFLRCLVGSSCAHYQNKLETKKQYLTTLRERIHGEDKKKLEKTNKKQYLKTLWESSIDKIKKNSRKPKNQNFSENVWSEAHVCFFFGFA